jgi:microcin C transport system substrate-binding protein
MNRNTATFICSIMLMILTGCSPDPGQQPVTSNDATAPAVAEVALPEYPAHELPAGLVWETNQEAPVYASPDAKKGGTFNTFVLSFPLTLRTVGPDSNGSFRPYILDSLPGLVELHPNTLEWVPGMATHWAYGEDGRSVYYRINPEAKWSDGKPITADDFVFTRDFMLSEFIVDPWSNNYYKEEIIEVKKYDDLTFSVTGAVVKPKGDLLYYYSIQPTPRHFHKLDEKWVNDYNWLVAPNWGPYQISRIEKGKYIEFTRKQDWWGNDLRYYKNRYNVEKIVVSVIRDMETAYRHFLRAELDSFGLIMPNFWYDKTDDMVYKNGYVNRIWFYNELPQPKQGMYLNMDYDLFEDVNVRYGFAHSMNIQMMIETVLRNDYDRMNSFHEGSGEYSNLDIVAREFNLDKADEYFAMAGWQQRGPDGIRVKDGQRMTASITYSIQAHTDRLVVLKEEAKKAGVELTLNLLDNSSAFKNILEKKHQIAWMGWSASYRPEFWEHFHSENAHKPQTNNITNSDDAEMDDLIIKYRESTDEAERKAISRQVQQKIHDIGAFIPTYKVPYTREAYWRWLVLPEWHATKSSDVIFDPVMSGLFWIDEEIKKETQQAMKSGTSFEPVLIIDETYKVNK